MKIAIFLVVTQQAVVIPYRRFGTTYWSHLLRVVRSLPTLR